MARVAGCRRRRGLARRVVLAVVGFVWLLGMSAAPASADSPLTWAAPALADHQVTIWNASARFVGVACPSIAVCAGVDGYGRVVVSTDPTATTPTWTVNTIEQGAGYTAVSCASASLCVVVGNGAAAAISTNPTAAAPTWTVNPGADHVNNTIVNLTAVSCPSTLLCVAVDDHGNVVTSTNPTAATPTWTVTNVDGTRPIAAVSCASTTLCVAGDSQGNTVTSTNPGAATPTWMVTNVDPQTFFIGIASVSCPTTGLCAVGDNDGNVLTSTNPAAATPNWTLTNVNNSSSVYGVAGVSCASTALCVAVESDGRVVTSTDPTAVTPTWTITTTDAANYLKAVACPATLLCVATDSAGNVVVSTNPATATPTWTATPVDGTNTIEGAACQAAGMCVLVDNTGDVVTSTNPSVATPTWTVANVDGLNTIRAVSCVSTSLCVAGDDQGNTLISTNPSAPTPTWTVTHVTAAFGGISTVSCPATSLCLANAGTGLLISNNPTAATPTWTPDAAGPGAISCSSTTLCAGTGGSSGSDVLISTNPTAATPTWTTTHTGFPFGITLTSISCPSTALCVALTSDGAITSSTDPTAPTPTWSGAGDAGFCGAVACAPISCPSVSLCVYSDFIGDVVTSSNPTGGTSAWTRMHVLGAGYYVGGGGALNPITALSCASASLCVAANADGRVVVGTPAPTHNLSVSLAGSGSGSVTGTGINCPGTCSHDYSNGTMVALTAAPASGSTFTGWSGGGCSGTGTCTVTMSADQSVTATFAPITHSLTVTLAGTGTGSVTGSGISCSGTCSLDYTQGTMVTLTAAPDSGSTFGGWAGGGCSGTGTCTVTLTTDQSISAVFNPAPPKLTVGLAGDGGGFVTGTGISCPSICSHAYSSGTMVTLTANAPSGSTFAGWSGGGCSGIQGCTVTMSADQSVTATFTLFTSAPKTLTVSLGGTGSGTVTGTGIDCPGSCSHGYPQGTVVDLTATSSTGSVFAGWSGGGCSGTAGCAVTLNTDESVTATFTTIATYKLNVALAGTGPGKVTVNGIDCPGTCSHSYNEGTVVALRASPQAGATFVGWSGGGCSTAADCNVTMSAAQNVTATFKAHVFELAFLPYCYPAAPPASSLPPGSVINNSAGGILHAILQSGPGLTNVWFHIDGAPTFQTFSGGATLFEPVGDTYHGIDSVGVNGLAPHSVDQGLGPVSPPSDNVWSGGLAYDATYNYRAMATSGGGQTVVGPQCSFRTPHKPKTSIAPPAPAPNGINDTITMPPGGGTTTITADPVPGDPFTPAPGAARGDDPLKPPGITDPCIIYSWLKFPAGGGEWMRYLNPAIPRCVAPKAIDLSAAQATVSIVRTLPLIASTKRVLKGGRHRLTFTFSAKQRRAVLRLARHGREKLYVIVAVKAVGISQVITHTFTISLRLGRKR
jgi:Divergent InlB B-repeat domain